ncbi:hypothetical protein EUX98_g4696 [Antrodiella citrinella]|uniref:Uncharacterized protein n=1 Tax=Antrodiella citrinella TaxID=2447956 RepID=A0A4V3XIK3_9APHY|nr:hypothetical protein EUX98_g4696 [Antrodiella citrinella]
MNATSPLDESPNLDAFDFTKVSVKVNSFWVVQLMHMSYETSDGKISDTYVEGSQPTFNFVIYDETSSFRIAEPLKKAGLPSSDVVLQCIKRAIASPMPPFSKSLPGLLLIALKLEPHVTTLRPFLDSLPAPFTWRLETPEEAGEVADSVDQMNKTGIAEGLRSGSRSKVLGNDAMKRKNRPDAVRHYTDAVGWLWGAASQKPDTKELKEIDALWSVCLGNRAAAYLMDGEGQDAAKALQDALEACKLNKDYAKAYYRQAQAFQILNEQSKAIEAIIAALHRPSLSKDQSLNDTLLELYGGLPDSGPDIQAFCVKVFKGRYSERSLL